MQEREKYKCKFPHRAQYKKMKNIPTGFSYIQESHTDVYIYSDAFEYGFRTHKNTQLHNTTLCPPSKMNLIFFSLFFWILNDRV